MCFYDFVFRIFSERTDQVAISLHSALCLYVSYSFEAFYFYEIEDFLFAPYVHHQSSTNYDFAYHSMNLIIHTGSPNEDPIKFSCLFSNELVCRVGKWLATKGLNNRVKCTIVSIGLIGPFPSGALSCSKQEKW